MRVLGLSGKVLRVAGCPFSAGRQGSGLRFRRLGRLMREAAMTNMGPWRPCGAASPCLCS
jgi:hypothetical protein